MGDRSRLRAAVTLAALAAVSGASATGVAPKLTLVTRAPLAVRGTGFRPSEQVTVTAMTLAGPRRAVVRSTRAGRFALTVRTVNQPCGHALAVRAVGSRGSLATLRLAAVPCVPPPID